MTAPGRTKRLEPRWPPIVATLLVLGLLALLPGRLRVFPPWGAYVIVVVVLVPMFAVMLTRGAARWLRAERVLTRVFFLVATVSNVVNLSNLVRLIVGHPVGIGGMQLLASSIGVWIINVLVYSLLYWQIDRGGPEARANGGLVRPDWQFPQTGVPDEAPLDWRPTFVDYLFLSYSTATAFSPTDALPLTSRAKLLMMLQSTVSLVTIVVVASRAINILGN